MKKFFLCIMITLLFIGCKSDDNPNLDLTIVGKWKMVEQLVDPGDGSGTFQPITSNRVIEFFEDGTVTINGVLCNLTFQTGDNNSGTYIITSSNEADTTYDGFIIPDNCTFNDTKIYLSVTFENKLLLWYPCIEACVQMFVKI